MMVFGLPKKREGASVEPFPVSPPSLGPPTDLVISMRAQGFTNNQIVQALQRDGYTSDQIFDAMNQADIKSGGPIQRPLSEQDFGEIPEPSMGPAPISEESERERIEELTEAIIDEKWSDLTASISRVLEWKNKTEARIEAFEQKVADLQKSFDELHKALVGKIGEYDKHILDVGTDIQAMEMVFKKVLPTFTQNINELSRLVKKTKTKK